MVVGAAAVVWAVLAVLLRLATSSLDDSAKLLCVPYSSASP